MNPVRILLALLSGAMVASVGWSQTPVPKNGSTPATKAPAAAAGSGQAAAANTAPARRSQWNGYERIDFTWAGRPCVLVQPKEAAPGKPWIWRMESFDVQPQVDQALLAKGWHVAYMDARDLYGAPRAIAMFNELYAHLVIHAELAKRVVLEGFGRGALYALNFAATHPTRVAAMYLDSPVVDLNSWPGRDKASREWGQMLEAYGLTEEKYATFRGNPVNKVDRLAVAKIPIVIVAGANIEGAPYEENGGVIEKRYRAASAPVEVMMPPGAGPSSPGAVDPKPVVDFLMDNARP